MRAPLPTSVDLTPPGFSEGLDDWSAGDGTPDSPTYECAEHVRIALNDPDFGTCLEMRKVDPVQRLRYMAEMPVLPHAFIEIRTRIKLLRGAAPGVRIAAFPGGLYGRQVEDLAREAPVLLSRGEGAVQEVRAVIGPVAAEGVDLVWDGRVLYAHVGLDLVGPVGGVVRIERFAVTDVTHLYAPANGG